MSTESKTPKYPPGFEPPEASDAAENDVKDVKKESDEKKKSMKSENQPPTATANLEESHVESGAIEEKKKNEEDETTKHPKEKLKSDETKETDESMKNIEEIDDNESENVVVTILATSVESGLITGEVDGDEIRREDVDDVKDQMEISDGLKVQAGTVDVDDKDKSEKSATEVQEESKPKDAEVNQLYKRVEPVDNVFLNDIAAIHMHKQLKLNDATAGEVQGPVQVVADDFLDKISTSQKTTVTGGVKNIVDKFESATKKEDQSKQAKTSQVPFMNDDFLDEIDTSPSTKIQTHVEVVGDSFLDELDARSRKQEKVQLIDDNDLMDQSADGLVQVAGDEFLDQLEGGRVQYDVAGEEFLDETASSTATMVEIVSDDFLDKLEGGRVQKECDKICDDQAAKAEMAGDEFLDLVDTVKTKAGNNVEGEAEKIELMDDEFLDNIGKAAPDAVIIEEKKDVENKSPKIDDVADQAQAKKNFEADLTVVEKAAAKEDKIDKDETVEAKQHSLQSSAPFSCTNLADDQGGKVAAAEKVHTCESEESAKSEQLLTHTNASFSCDNVASKKAEENVVEKHEQRIEAENVSPQYQEKSKSVEVGLEKRVENEAIQDQKEEDESKPVETAPGLDQEKPAKSQQQPLQAKNGQQQAAEEEDDEFMDAELPLDNLEEEEIPSDELPTNEELEAAAAEAIKNQAFNNDFDEYFAKFLDNDLSQMDEQEIKNFAEKVPADYIVSEDRYPLLFKVLFKIKEAPKKAIIDESLALLQKLFKNINYNKVLVEYWNCDEFKERENGPLGYSFTGNKHIYDFSGIHPRDYNDAAKVNAKASDVAWSMLLDPEATVNAILEVCVNNKLMVEFYQAVLRKFKCLGEYMLKSENEEEFPIFLFVYRKKFADAEAMKLNSALATLCAVCKSPKGEDGEYAIKPNYVLNELVSYILRDDSKQEKYMVALRHFFDHTPGHECHIEWSAESDNFDNPSKFLLHFIKYYNRKNTVEANNVFYLIFAGFKASLNHTGYQLDSLGTFDDDAELDWPFVYKIFKFLDIQNFRYPIPTSLFLILPQEEIPNFMELHDPEPSLDKALIGIFEGAFVCEKNAEIPEVFYKELFKLYESSKSIVETLASAIIQAHNNVKDSVNIQIKSLEDAKFFCEFIIKLYQSYYDQDFVRKATLGFGMSCELIIENSHLLVIGRAMRLIVEDRYQAEEKKSGFTSVGPFFADLFSIFSSKTFDKFQELKTDTQGTWPPWRNGTGGKMGDEKAMALNYILNEIQKEIFCVFDLTFAPSQGLIDNLYYLARQRKYYGLYHPRVEEILRTRYPELFEHPLRRGPPRDDGYGQSRDQDYRPPRGGGSGRGGFASGGQDDLQQDWGGYAGGNSRGGGRGGGAYSSTARNDFGNGNNDQQEQPQQYGRGGYRGGGGRGSVSVQNNGQDFNEEQNFQSGGYGRGGGGRGGSSAYSNNTRNDYHDNNNQQEQPQQQYGRGGYRGGGGGRGSANAHNDSQRDNYHQSQPQDYSTARGGSYVGRGGNYASRGGGAQDYNNQNETHQQSGRGGAYSSGRGGNYNGSRGGGSGYTSGAQGDYQSNNQENFNEPQQQSGGRGGGYSGGSGRGSWSRGAYSNGSRDCLQTGFDYTPPPPRQEGNDNQRSQGGGTTSTPSNRGNSYSGGQNDNRQSSQGYNQSRQDDCPMDPQNEYENDAPGW